MLPFTIRSKNGARYRHCGDRTSVESHQVIRSSTGDAQIFEGLVMSIRARLVMPIFYSEVTRARVDVSHVQKGKSDTALSSQSVLPVLYGTRRKPKIWSNRAYRQQQQHHACRPAAARLFRNAAQHPAHLPIPIATHSAFHPTSQPAITINTPPWRSTASERMP